MPKPHECTNPKADRGFYLHTEHLVTFTKGSDELHGSLKVLLEVLSVTLINRVEYKSNIMRRVDVVYV